MNTGRRAEAIAGAWLEARGLRVLARNYRCRAGELDLVLLDGDELVIAEVRYRRSAGFGRPEETVTAAKQHRITIAARHFLATHPRLEFSAVRFDVVAVAHDLASPAIEWIRDAFVPH